MKRSTMRGVASVLAVLAASLGGSASAGAQPCQGCAGDFNGDDRVTIAELVRGVNNALEGCGPLSDDQAWVATWSASPTTTAAGFDNTTLRLVVHTSVGGDRVRVRLSNAYGTQAAEIAAAHVAISSGTAAIVAESDRALTFSGAPAIAIPPGAAVVSDPAMLDVPALGDLAVSIFLARDTGPATAHTIATQTSYVAASGDFTASSDATPFTATTDSWFFLTDVDVRTSHPRHTIVAFGDSITDGAASTSDTNNRWPDELARRLHADGRDVGVVNTGISGNRVLHDGGSVAVFGQNALARFDRDVLTQTAVSHVVVLGGINDIGLPGALSAPDDAVTADEIIAGLQQLINRAQARRVTIFGGTLTPFEDALYPGYYSPEGEAKRQAVNEWIRTGGAFDAVIDFDAAVRDPSHPARMLPAYDSGDHLHPSDAGYKAMGDAIDLSLFSAEECDRPQP